MIELVEPAAPGMFARLTLELQRAENAILVPNGTILTTPTGGQIVFVVHQGKARRRDVELGIQGEHAVQIIEGIEAGERVVVAGRQALRDGQAVRVAGQPKRDGGKGSAGSPRSSTRSAPDEGAGL